MKNLLPRASVTGWAVRSPFESDIDDLYRRLVAGETAIGPHRWLPRDAYTCRLSASIDGVPARSRHRRFVRRIGLWGMEAAHEAFEMSGIDGGPRVGVMTGYGGLRVYWDEMMPALAEQTEEHDEIWERGFRDFHPFWMLKHLSNNAHALFAADVCARGEGVTYGGTTSGVTALAGAIEALHAGRADAVVVFAYDTLVQPNILVEWEVSGIGNTRSVERRRPAYDTDASGMVPSEAAAAVVLERAEDAGDRALCHLSALDSADGSTSLPAADCFNRFPSGIFDGAGVVDGASSGLTTLDDEERRIVANRTGEDIPLTSLSASFGHVGAALPLLQTIVLTRSLADGVLPPIAGIVEPRPGPLEPVTNASETDATTAVGLTAYSPGLLGAIRVELP